MEFDLDEDQRTLRDEARRFLERETPVAYARAMMDDPRGYREDVWRRMADLGWMALPFPEKAGGIGHGFIALSILLSEMGRVVLPGPYFSTVVLAGHALLQAQDEDGSLLTSVCSGDCVASLAFDESPSRWDERGVSLVARPSGGRFALTGRKVFVLDGTAATRLVVAARAPDGVGLFLTEPDEGRRAATPIAWMDQTRKAADVVLDGTPARRIGPPGWPLIQRVLDRASVGLAAEMLGGAERVLEMSVEYARARVQFGRPIGSFQAVKHRAADMLLDVESLRSAVYYAAWALERDSDDASLAASMAKAYASDAYRRVAASGIQIHGGLGFTWEHDAHLYFKRAKASEALFGDAVWHRERMAQILRQRFAPTAG